MLTAFGRHVRGWTARPPWTNTVGLARTLLALGTLGTLAANSTDTLFRPTALSADVISCSGPAGMGLFCLDLPGGLEAARWIGVAVLVLVASGWRPRWTSLPHWWVSFSAMWSITPTDGGDQVTAVLTLLLLPIALTDSRRWHWDVPPQSPAGPADVGFRRIVSHFTLVAVRLQVAVIYFHAAVSKMGVTEWVDGTALYYWMTSPITASPAWLDPVVQPIVTSALGVTALSWGTIVLELLLALGLVLPRWTWRPLLIGGIMLHASITVMIGLLSFSIAMAAALILYLCPAGRQLALAGAVSPKRWLSRRAPEVRSLPRVATTAWSLTGPRAGEHDARPACATPGPSPAYPSPRS